MEQVDVSKARRTVIAALFLGIIAELSDVVSAVLSGLEYHRWPFAQTVMLVGMTGLTLVLVERLRSYRQT